MKYPLEALAMANRQWYEDYQQELEAEQAGKSAPQVADELRNKRDDTGKPIYSHVFDPDNATPIKHRWIDRGLKMSCEGAGHPYHQAWKKR